MKKHKIAFHEKKLGQLFCDNKAKDLLDKLLQECQGLDVTIQLNESVTKIKQRTDHFELSSTMGNYACESLVIATGGLSIPTLGSSPFGYEVAKQFGIPVHPTRAGLVPFVLSPEDKKQYSVLSGISNDARVKSSNIFFDENILITHKGLSGPAILQISNYWRSKEPIIIDLSPHQKMDEILKNAKISQPNAQLKTVLGQYFSKRLVNVLLGETLESRVMNSFSNQECEKIAKIWHEWRCIPAGTEGYKTAEVTIGGVDCHAISSKTMEANEVKGLYFIGEVLDVTGWLGGVQLSMGLVFWMGSWTSRINKDGCPVYNMGST